MTEEIFNIPEQDPPIPELENNTNDSLEMDIPNGGIVQRLPEAGGVVWRKLYDTDGNQITITTRSFNAQLALDELMSLTAYANQKYGLLTTPPKNPLPSEFVVTQETPTDNVIVVPQSKPQNQSQSYQNTGIEEIEVQKMAHQVTMNGIHYLGIYGGRYMKFGVKAYKEALPPSLQAFEKLEIGKSFDVPKGAIKAIYDHEKKKVVSLASNITLKSS